jgi:hypothetical protein
MTLLQDLSEKVTPTVRIFPFEIAAAEPGTSTFQLASLLEQIQRATLEAKRLVAGRLADDLSGGLQTESWSAAECLDHLARTTRSFLPAISKAIAAAPQLMTERPLRTGTVAALLIRNLEPPYRMRYKVLAQLAPQEKDFEAAWLAFDESQSRLLESICSATGLAIDKVKVACPVYVHLTYNVYGAFRMLAAHQRRHLWQIRRILATLDDRRQQEPAV